MSQTNLASKMVTVAASLGWVQKAGKNTAQNYDFVRAVDVFAQVRKLLAEQRIVFSLDIESVEHIPFTTKSGTPTFLTTVKGNASFIDADTGEVITGGVAGTGADSGDKSTAKAITAMLKYALIGAYLLPTGDDPEATDEEGASTSRTTASAPRTTSAPVPPKAEKATSGLSDPQRNKLMARLNDVGLGSPNQRKAFLLQLLQKQSTKQMTPGDLDRALAELDDPKSRIVDNARAVQ